jgi:hypothetical protein
MSKFFHSLSQKADTPLKRIGLSLLILALIVFVLDFIAWMVFGGGSKARELSSFFETRYSRGNVYGKMAYASIIGFAVGFTLYKGWIDKFCAWIKTGNANK